MLETSLLNVHGSGAVAADTRVRLPNRVRISKFSFLAPAFQPPVQERLALFLGYRHRADTRGSPMAFLLASQLQLL